MVGVGVVVAILALVALLGGLGAAVVVTGISYTSHDDACGMNGLTEPGFTASTRAALHVGVVVTNEAHLACTIASVGSATPGFGITGANVPLIIPGGGQAQLTYTVHPPASPYNGPLSIDVE